MTTEPADFLARLEAARAKRDALKAAGTHSTPAPRKPETYVPDEDIPDLGTDDTYIEERTELDGIIAGIDILDAYDRWVGKNRQEAGGRREGIKVSCPTRGHRDSDPSAWVNLDKQTWFCGGCEIGGDIFDIANYKYEIDYKGDSSKFVELKKAMAGDLGWVARTTPGGTTYYDKVEVLDDADGLGGISGDHGDGGGVDGDMPDSPEAESTTVIPLGSSMDVEEASLLGRMSLDWHALVQEDSFLDKWMKVVTRDDLPEEYYFWHGLTAIGMALGRSTTLLDQPYVHGNLFICLMGPSGIGKSRSTGFLNHLLREALPYDHDEPTSTGTLIVPSPGSAEALVDSFSKPIFDDEDNPKKITGYGRVRGIVNFSELSLLIGRANRTGSAMKPTLMDFYDASPVVEVKSRGHGLSRAEQPFCSSITSSQPRALRELLSGGDVDSGFVNRWVFVMGKSKKLMPVRRKPMSGFDDAKEALQNLRAWGLRTRTIDWSDEGYDAWAEFFEDVIAPMKLDEESTGLTTRLDLTLKKCMLLLCANEGLTQVTPGIVEKVKIIAEYLIATYQFVYGKIGLGAFEDVHQQILTFMEKTGGRATSAREINRACRSLKQPTDLVVKVIKTMVEIGELSESVLKGSRGPATIRYTLVK